MAQVMPRYPREPKEEKRKRKRKTPKKGFDTSPAGSSSSSTRPGGHIRLAAQAALVIAQRVWALLHRMVADRVRVAAQAAPAADPEPVQLLQPARAPAALRAGQAPATGARVVEVDPQAAALLVKVGRVRAGGPGLERRVERGGRAEDIVYDKLDVPRAWGTVVVMEVVVDTHGCRVPRAELVRRLGLKYSQGGVLLISWRDRSRPCGAGEVSIGNLEAPEGLDLEASLEWRVDAGWVGGWVCGWGTLAWSSDDYGE